MSYKTDLIEAITKLAREQERTNYLLAQLCGFASVDHDKTDTSTSEELACAYLNQSNDYVDS